MFKSEPNVADALKVIKDALKASNKEAEKTRLMLREILSDERQDLYMKFILQMSNELNDYLERRKRSRECAGMFQKIPKCHHVVNVGIEDEYWEQLRIEIAKEELSHLLKLRENKGVYFDKPMEVLAVEYADTFINELKKKPSCVPDKQEK